MSPLHRSWLADEAARTHEGPQTAEDWGNALDKPTPKCWPQPSCCVSR